MFRIAICDDDHNFINDIKRHLDSWNNQPNNTALSYFNDGDTLITAHQSTPFDIILMDVVMPLINGIDTAKEIRSVDKEVKIVFLTSSSEYAVESYTVKANNYLLKPVDPKALYECLDELVYSLRNSIKNIVIKCNDGIHRIPLDDIEYIEASSKHTLFALTNGKRIESIRPFNAFESDFLMYNFCKCHRSYLVNIDHIRSYTNSEIKTGTGSILPISRNRFKDFENTYFSKMFEKAGE